MFWSMRYAATSSIDTILEKEGGFTLEELLEEDELLQECKSQNTKLLELCVHVPFAAPRGLCPPRTPPRRSLCEPESLAKMVSYIVTMPSEDDSESRRYKCGLPVPPEHCAEPVPAPAY